MTDDPDAPPHPPAWLVKIMNVMAKMAPPEPNGENPKAVRAFARMERVKDVLTAGPLRRRIAHPVGRAWPVMPGEFVLGDPAGSVAVCVLTSKDLAEQVAKLPGVAIAGRVFTVNLGIERIIQNVLANPAIKVLLVCGKESAVFHPAQAIASLFQNGVDGTRRIVGAVGHLPVLANLTPRAIDTFRAGVKFADLTGVLDLSAIASAVTACARDAAAMPARTALDDLAVSSPQFKHLDSGGHRAPLAYDPNGFFIISLDRDAGEILCRHYSTDNAPQHEVRARMGERILLALLRENLVSQMSHAGYLGAELAKAETALQLGLHYEQDHRLRDTKS